MVLVFILMSAGVSAQELTGDARAEYDRLMKEADTFFAANQSAEMLARAEAATRLARRADDAMRTARALQRITNALYTMGRTMEAMASAREALTLAEGLADRRFLAQQLNNVGVLLREAGDFEGAIDYALRAAEHFDAIGTPIDRALAYRNISSLYYRMNDAAASLRSARDAYAHAITGADPAIQLATLQSVAGAERLLGEYDKAAATLDRALALEVPAGGRNQTLRKETLTDRASLDYLRGRYESARTIAHEALAVPEPYPLAEGLAMFALGVSTLALGDAADALQWLYKARDAFRPPGAESATHATLVGSADMQIARALRRLGRREEALAVHAGSLAAAERLRVGSGLTGAVQARMFTGATGFFSIERVYEYVDLLFEMGRVEEAFDVSERWRGRVFLEQLDERRSGVGRALNPEQQQRETALTTRATVVQRQLWDLNATAARRAELESELAAIDKQLENLRREVRLADPKYGQIRYPSILSATALQQQLAADSVTVSYLMGESRSYVWAISSRGVTAALLPPAKELNARLVAFRRLLMARPAGAIDERRARIEREAAALYRTLIDPIAGSLRERTRVTFVADGALHEVPFEALRNGARGRWLLEEIDVSYAPSASAVAALQGRARAAVPPPSLLAIGDPVFPAGRTPPIAPGAIAGAERALMFTALPFTRVEIDGIASLFPRAARRVYLGADAREENVKHAPLTQYRYLHFASHAYVHPTRPGRSAVVLTIDRASREDGVLDADEVMDLRLEAEMVTLSACHTGAGEVIGTEGVIGLARAFLHAGARSVTASLWNVNDSATAGLMKAFYAELQKGLPRDTALRRAKLQLARSNGPLHDPYYWAPFVLIGVAR